LEGPGDLVRSDGGLPLELGLRSFSQMHFSAEQILSDYKRDGVVRLQQFFSPEEVKRVRQELEYS
jgi:hypothetical protein